MVALEPSPQYVQLRWRLEVPLGCRRALGTAGLPLYTLSLTTINPISGAIQTSWFICSYADLLNIKISFEAALAALTSPRYCRFSNLIK
ncbi:hypothetical protein BCY84_05956 [Trypanosoma cruzi cruzi]|nr:hypothetical protein BCY84_05956 [Trypanosoma cruzi cruzi]